MKKKILFVCLGNICRSPAAEYVFRDIINKAGLSDQFIVDSAGTAGWHVGKKADKRMRDAAIKRDIDIKSIARQIEIDDLLFYDFILTMDNDNYNNVKLLFDPLTQESPATIKPILSYSKKAQISEVPDPYYGGKDGFENVLDLLEEACSEFLKSITIDS